MTTAFEMTKKIAFTRKPRPHKKAQKEDGIRVFLRDNADKLAARSMLVMGLFALFSYFFCIDYFPLVDLQAAASYVLALAYVLIVLATTLSLAILYPYLPMAMVIRSRPTKMGPGKFYAEIIEWTFFGILCLSALAALAFLDVANGWGFKLALLLYAVIVLMLFALRIFFLTLHRARRHHYTIKAQFRKLKSSKRIRAIFWAQFGGVLLVGFLQLVAIIPLLLILSKASDISSDDYGAMLQAASQYAMCTAPAGACLLIIGLSPEYRKNWYFGIPMILFLPLGFSFFLQSPGMLPMTIAQVTKIGNFHAEKIVFAAKACDTIGPILALKCDSKANKPIELCNVQVMSRIGPETYLRVPLKSTDKKGKHQVRRILLPTSDIASMDVNFDLKLLSMKKIDNELSQLSFECQTNITTLYGDSAFRFDNFTLTEAGKAGLASTIQNAKDAPTTVKEIRVTGHADQIGSANHNSWLAERRAAEVRLFIERELQNISPHIKLIEISKGSSQPMISDCTSARDKVACEAPNRRVEVEIVRGNTDRHSVEREEKAN